MRQFAVSAYTHAVWTPEHTPAAAAAAAVAAGGGGAGAW
jgi:hypothetical protein